MGVKLTQGWRKRSDSSAGCKIGLGGGGGTQPDSKGTSVGEVVDHHNPPPRPGPRQGGVFAGEPVRRSPRASVQFLHPEGGAGGRAAPLAPGTTRTHQCQSRPPAAGRARRGAPLSSWLGSTEAGRRASYCEEGRRRRSRPAAASLSSSSDWPSGD